MKNSEYKKAFEGKHVDANFIKNILEDNDLAYELSTNAHQKALTYDWKSVSLKWKKLFNIIEEK